jgi:hypothetical protein
MLRILKKQNDEIRKEKLTKEKLGLEKVSFEKGPPWKRVKKVKRQARKISNLDSLNGITSPSIRYRI